MVRPVSFYKDLSKEIIPNPSPRPYPDYTALPVYKYLPLEQTPTENRTTDYFLPRANLKSQFKNNAMASTDDNAIQSFADKFITERDHVTTYLQHLEILETKKEKRQEKRTSENTKRPGQDTQTADSETVRSDDEYEIVAVIANQTTDESDSDTEVQQVPIRKSKQTERTTFQTRKFFGDIDS